MLDMCVLYCFITVYKIYPTEGNHHVTMVIKRTKTRKVSPLSLSLSLSLSIATAPAAGLGCLPDAQPKGATVKFHQI